MIDFSKLEKVKTAEDLKHEEDYSIAIKYMKDTDWYVIRKFETGQDIPIDVSKNRQNARAVLSN